MRTSSSFDGTGRGAEPESDVHPELRGNIALWSVLSLIALGSLFLLILAKNWKDLSASAVSWMGFSFFWTVLMFRETQITNGKLRMILALAQVEPADKKQPLDKVLNITTEAVNKILYRCSLAFLGLWMVIGTILSKHHPW
jgi:hypothetical protein